VNGKTKAPESVLDAAQERFRRRRREKTIRWLERHGATRTGLRAARAVRRAAAGEVKCGVCGQWLAKGEALGHFERHQAEAEREAAAAHERSRRRTEKVVRQATPAPTKPRTKPTPPPPAPPAASAPKGGSAMSNGHGTPETQNLTRAALLVAEMDPATAWDLDAQLAGLSQASLALTEALGEWVETLNQLRVDVRVMGQTSGAVAHLAEVVAMFQRTRQSFRAMYAAHFEAAEAGVSEVKRAGFWDTSNADAA